MFARLVEPGLAFLFACALTASSPALAANDGIITVKSAYSIADAVAVAARSIADVVKSARTKRRHPGSG